MSVLKSIKIKLRLAKLKNLAESSFLNSQISYGLFRRIKAIHKGSNEKYVACLMEAYQLFARSTGYYKSHPNMKAISDRWLERTLKERGIKDEINQEADC